MNPFQCKIFINKYYIFILLISILSIVRLVLPVWIAGSIVSSVMTIAIATIVVDRVTSKVGEQEALEKIKLKHATREVDYLCKRCPC